MLERTSGTLSGFLASSADLLISLFVVFFFFQAEDGIRFHCVTGVQTCALPISLDGMTGKGVWSIVEDREGYLWFGTLGRGAVRYDQIGRASCRDRV